VEDRVGCAATAVAASTPLDDPQRDAADCIVEDPLGDRRT